MSIKKYLLILPILLILTDCSAQIDEQNNNSATIIQDDNKVIMYDMNTIAQHNSKDSCWLLIDNKVYDVTEMIAGHGGGDAILEGCGIDSTELYYTRPISSGKPHSPKAQSYLPNFYIGELQQ